MDAPHVFVRVWALGCFYSHISTQTFRRALTASVDSLLRGDKEGPFSGVTKSGRVWRKVPESDARSVRGSFITLFCSFGALYGPDRFLAHTVVPSLRFFRWCIVW